MTTVQSTDIQAALLGHNTRYMVLFQDMYANSKPGPYLAWTEEISAPGVQQITYGFLNNLPRMRKWTGARQHKNLRAFVASIVYDKYEGTMDLPRPTVVYDKSGIVDRTLAKYVQSAIDFKDDVIEAQYDGNSGAGPTGVDGVALFSASHPFAPSAGTQSNLSAGTNLSHSALVTMEQTGMLLVEESGRPMRVQYDTIRVGPKLKRRAQELVSADRVVIVNTDGSMDTPRTTTSAFDVQAAASRTSVWQGDMTLIVDARVSGTGGFFWDVIDSTKDKAMILFITRDVEAINRLRMDDPQRFEHDDFTYGLEADVGIGAGFWPGVARATGTA